MAALKPAVRLGLGWALMLAGAWGLLDACLAPAPRGKTLTALEALGGAALAAAGLFLRRMTLAKLGAVDDSDRG